MSVTVGDRVQDVGFPDLLVQDSVFRFEGFGWGSQGLRVQDVKLGFRIWVSGAKIQGSAFDA